MLVLPNITTTKKPEKIMYSIKAYGKVDEAEQAILLEARRKTRKRIAIISLSTIVLVGVVCAAVFGTVARNNNDHSSNDDNSQSLSNSVKAVCDVTLYKDACYSSLGPLVHSGQVQPEELFMLSIKVALTEVSRAAQHFSEQGAFKGLIDNRAKEALKNCQDLLGLAVDHLNSSLNSSSGEKSSLLDVLEDLKTWLSAAGIY